MTLRSSAASVIGCLATAGGRDSAIAGLLRPLLLGQPEASSSASSISWPSCPITSPASLCSSRSYARGSRGSATTREAGSAPSTSASTGTAKVVLLQAIPGIGAKGSVVEANTGWMRHVLFPQKKAVYATPENIEAFSMSAEERAATQDPELLKERRLKKLINSLGTMHVFINRRSDWFKKQPDKMLGSVSTWDILKAVELQYGIKLHESHLFIAQAITTFGTFKIPLNLRTQDDRQLELTVSVSSVRWINHGHAYV